MMLAASGALAGACGGGGVSPAPTAASSASELGGSPSGAATPSAVAEDTSSPEASDSTTAESPEPDESESSASASTDPSDEDSPKPPVLDKTATGRDLTTADFFAKPDDWNDGRFNVAGKQALSGVAGTLQRCEDEAGDDTPTAELRLANNFSTIEMNLGQDDDSESSDSVVTVRLLGNGKYIDEAKVPFNSIRPFKASVAGVNALKIQTFKGGVKCDYDKSVSVVLMGLRVR